MHSADFKTLYNHSRILSFYGETDKIFPMSSMVKNIPVPHNSADTDSFVNIDSSAKNQESQGIKNAKNLIIKLFICGAAVTALWIYNCVQKRKIEDLKQAIETLSQEIEKLQKFIAK